MVPCRWLGTSALAGSACALPGFRPVHMSVLRSRGHRTSRAWTTSRSVGAPTSFLPFRRRRGGWFDPWGSRRASMAARSSPKELCADLPTRRSDDPGARVLCATPQGAHSLVCGFGDHLTVTTQTHLLSHVFPELLDCLRLHFPRFANRPQRHWLSLEGGISRRVFRHLLMETP